MPPPIEAASPSTGFQDRKGLLVLFGIFTILGGLMVALMVSLMILGQSLSAKAGNPQSIQLVLPALLMYGGLAIVLIWLGIGSIMARRWARALLLIVSWSGLLVGVITMVMMAWMLPHITQMANAARPPGQAPLPHGSEAFFMIILMIVIGLLFIAVPLVWILFYQGRNVKATCEAYDPVERWTDRCPLPVIAICLWLTFSAVMMLMTAVAMKGVVPLFGVFLTGPLGAGIYVLVGLVWLYSVRAMFRLDSLGWWLVFVSMILFALSAFITYWRHDIAEFYTLMGYPEKQIADIQKLGIFKGRTMAWGTLLGMAPFLGYLLYVRRFFSSPQNHAAPAQPPLG